MAASSNFQTTPAPSGGWTSTAIPKKSETPPTPTTRNGNRSSIKGTDMAKSLRQAIRDNQRFHKYEKLLRRIRLRVFDYEDSDKSKKAERVIQRIKAICKPTWEKRARRQANKTLDRLRWS